jgi:hypothetical protein
LTTVQVGQVHDVNKGPDILEQDTANHSMSLKHTTHGKQLDIDVKKCKNNNDKNKDCMGRLGVDEMKWIVKSEILSCSNGGIHGNCGCFLG